LCICQSGYRDASGLCVDRCPTCLSGAMCTEGKDPVFYEFASTANEFSKVSMDVSLESCSPPSIVPIRGAIFDGETSRLQLKDLRMSQEFTFKFWMKMEKGNASILSYSTSFYNNSKYLDLYEENCEP